MDPAPFSHTRHDDPGRLKRFRRQELRDLMDMPFKGDVSDSKNGILT
jgi:hypothetical protein